MVGLVDGRGAAWRIARRAPPRPLTKDLGNGAWRKSRQKIVERKPSGGTAQGQQGDVVVEIGAAAISVDAVEQRLGEFR
jgi:hypothetical protein